MTTPHKHRDILIAIADGKQIQVTYADSEIPDNWWNTDPETVLTVIEKHPEYLFRIKPDTITVNGVECPKPLPITQPPTDYCVDTRMWCNPGNTTPQSRITVFFDTEADARKVYEACVSPFEEGK